MTQHGQLLVEDISVGPFEVNCYIAWHEEYKKALVIDPGCDADNIAAFLKDKNLTVAAYLLTHGHADHISALAALHAEFPAPTRIPPGDAEWAFSELNVFLPFYKRPIPPPGKLSPIVEGEALLDGDLQGRVISTPGHTPGGVCLYYPEEGVLFSGDTLFKASVGRSDLPGGDSRELARSLDRLAQLPDHVTVYPGHGPSTTIGVEKKTNFFMQQGAM